MSAVVTITAVTSDVSTSGTDLSVHACSRTMSTVASLVQSLLQIRRYGCPAVSFPARPLKVLRTDTSSRLIAQRQTCVTNGGHYGIL